MGSGPVDPSAAQGQITHGPAPNGLVSRTLEFIENELPRWRDRPDRREESAEERLNAQLCKHLNAEARHRLPAVQFHHEEKQAVMRRVDVSAGLVEGAMIGTTYHSIDDPFIVIEGKRLPPPGGKAREREYVTGGDSQTGGIQRFKLGLHGKGMPFAAMVGYVQKGTAVEWNRRINGWIADLVNALPLGEQWLATETLRVMKTDTKRRLSILESAHNRANTFGGRVELRHFWLEMTRNR